MSRGDEACSVDSGDFSFFAPSRCELKLKFLSIARTARVEILLSGITSGTGFGGVTAVGMVGLAAPLRCGAFDLKEYFTELSLSYASRLDGFGTKS